MKQTIIGGVQVAHATATRYFSPDGFTDGGVASATTEAMLVAESGNWMRSRIELSVAPGAGKSRVFTLYQNGSATAHTVTISDAATSGEDTTHTIAVTAGDRLNWEQVPSGTPATSAAYYASVFEPTTAQRAVWGGSNADAPLNSATEYNVLGGHASDVAWTATETAVNTMWDIDATLKSFWIVMSASPGAGNTSRWSVVKNGVVEATSTIDLVDANTAVQVTGLNIDMAPGDLFSVSHEPISSPTSGRTARWGISYQPDVDGEFNLSSPPVFAYPTTAATRYTAIPNTAIAPTTTEADHVVLGASALDPSGVYVAVTHLRFNLTAAPGVGNSHQVIFRKEGSNSSLSATIANAATDANASGTGITIAPGERAVYQLVSVGTPAASTGRIALRLKQTAAPGQGVAGSLLLLGVGV